MNMGTRENDAEFLRGREQPRPESVGHRCILKRKAIGKAREVLAAARRRGEGRLSVAS